MSDQERRDPDALDRRIDERLRAAFAPPPLEGVVERVARASERAPTRLVRRRAAILALAAAAIVVAAGLYFSTRTSDASASFDGPGLAQLWTASFRDVKARGVRAPDGCEACTDLSAMCRAVCAASLKLGSRPDLALVGVYSRLPCGPCLPLVVDANGAPVCIFVLPREKDPGVTLAESSGLRLHRRELGDLAIYELGESSAPRALDHFSMP